jgi:hypothetical protein
MFCRKPHNTETASDSDSNASQNSLRVRLVKTRKAFCKYALHSTLALVALLAVWGAVTAINVYWATTTIQQNNTDKIKEKGESFNTTSCHQSMRRNPSTNSCYIPCTEWELMED